MFKKKVDKKYFFDIITDNEIIFFVKNGNISLWLFFINEKGNNRLKKINPLLIKEYEYFFNFKRWYLKIYFERNKIKYYKKLIETEGF